MYNYSIIIPHKNIPKLLQRCLESIPERVDIQIIIGDDNSDPAIVDFEHFPGNNRCNTKIYFTKESKGAGYARNIGLEFAYGKWLLFADADDFFTYDAFSTFDKYLKSKEDIIYFKVISKDSETLEYSDRADYYNKLIENYSYSNTDSQRFLKYRHIVPWGKLIKRTLVVQNKLRFDEVKYSNDILFTTQVGYYAGNNIGIDMSCVYCITTTFGSLTRIMDIEAIICRYESTIKVNSFLSSVKQRKYQSSLLMYFSLAKKIKFRYCFKLLKIGIVNHANLLAGWRRLFSFQNNVSYKNRTHF